MRLANCNCFAKAAVFLLAFSVATLYPTVLVAQEYSGFSVADTSSPRDTLKSFIDACNELNGIIHREKFFDRTNLEHSNLHLQILDCIDASELPAFASKDRASEVAVCIKEILDRVELPAWDQIPDTEQIESAGGLEKLSIWRIPGTRITITRVEQGSQKHEYLFSPGTVDRAVEYFKSIESKPYRTEGPAVSENLYRWYMSVPGHPALAMVVERFPERLQHGSVLGLAVWKWLGLLIALLITISVMVLAYRLQQVFTKRVRDKSVFRYCLTIVFPMIATLAPLGFAYVIQYYLTVRGNPLYILSFVANLTALLAAVVVVFGATRRVAASIIASPRINPLGLNAQLIRITFQTISIVVTVILLLVGGQFLGIRIGALLASAGIGGIALAFGAQDTLKTLFGTISLIVDKPFRVGDRIQFMEYNGVVEDIGMRSTQIRLLSSHLVTIPNDRLASSDIENIGCRKYLRSKSEIHIPLDTACEDLEKVVAIIREKLVDHEGMDPDFPPRVFFDEFNAKAFIIQFFYWYTPPKYWDFKAFGEKLNFEIFREFEEQGIQFSLPVRHSYVRHSYWKHDGQQGPLDVKIIGDKSTQNDDT